VLPQKGQNLPAEIRGCCKGEDGRKGCEVHAGGPVGWG
jgi:hypothetical protein